MCLFELDDTCSDFIQTKSASQAECIMVHFLTSVSLYKAELQNAPFSYSPEQESLFFTRLQNIT